MLVMKNMQLLIMMLALFNSVYGQHAGWSTKKINEILTVDIPTNNKFEEQDIIKGYTGNIDEEYFAVSYYDTAMNVNDAQSFKISLTGFAHGMSKRVSQGEYQVTLSDTSLGNTKGIIIKFIANANATYQQNMVCYVTMANDHFYSFSSTMPTDIKKEALRLRFFNMIKFDAEKIKESKYSLDSVLIK